MCSEVLARDHSPTRVSSAALRKDRIIVPAISTGIDRRIRSTREPLVITSPTAYTSIAKQFIRDINQRRFGLFTPMALRDRCEYCTSIPLQLHCANASRLHSVSADTSQTHGYAQGASNANNKRVEQTFRRRLGLVPAI